MDDSEPTPLPDFDDLKSTLEWADQWAVEHGGPLIEAILEGETAHQLTFGREFGRARAQFYAELAALAVVIDQLNYTDRSSWPAHRTIQFALLAKNIGSLHSAFDRVYKGFYQDAISLIRSSYEAWLRAAFVSCHPGEPYAALADRTPAGVHSFNATNFVREELRLDWQVLYRITSVYAHGNMFETALSMKAAADAEREPERFGLANPYVQERVELVLPLLDFNLLLYLRMLAEVVVPPVQVAADVSRVCQEAAAFIQAKFERHPKPSWPSRMSDLDYVIELLQAAERSEDWKLLRNRRPVVQDDRQAWAPNQ